MIYLDNAATTKVQKDILPIIEKYYFEQYYNPSALYQNAIDVANDIKAARNNIAKLLNVDANTLHFTSSGTESDNQALFCAKKRKGSRIIISAVEHAAVYNSAMQLKQQGYDIAICEVNTDGSVNVESFKRLLNENTSMVSIMHVSNETGAINDIEKLVNITKSYDKNILFHSDGVQAFGKIPVNLKLLGVDYYTISGHKLGAPKGIAALYVKRGAHIVPLLYGGGQESGLRASTENVSGIILFEKASALYINQNEYLLKLSEKIFSDIRKILSDIPDIVFITSDKSAPHIITLALPYVRGEVMMHSLEKYGIIIGIGSACSSKKGTGRLQSGTGLSEKHRDGVIRLSIGLDNNIDDGKIAAEAIIVEYNKLKAYIRG